MEVKVKNRYKIFMLIFVLFIGFTSSTKELSPIVSQKYNITEETQEIFFRTYTGKAYYKENCYYLKSKIPISLNEAKIRGLHPCSKCKPLTK